MTQPGPGPGPRPETAPDQPAGPAARPSAAPAPAGVPLEPEARPIDFGAPQLTVRAIATGMVLGALLSLTNIYAGLKIGWGFNMSITAALLGFGFWRPMRAVGAKPFGLLENNINQTAASSGASISSAGLVAPIPALTILTGQTLSWPFLAVWTFSVTLVGIVVAVGLRRQMLLVDRLPFASGIAAAETLKEMYAKGKDAMARVYLLLGAGVAAAGVKLAEVLVPIARAAVPGTVAVGGALGTGTRASLYNLTFAFDPSVLLVGVGMLIGLRATVSLMLGAVVAWALVGPYALAQGWAEAGAAGQPWFGSMLKWLLWPGVAMMVTASLTSFAFSWRSVAAALAGRSGKGGKSEEDTGDVRRPVFLGGLAVALVFSVILQVVLFDIAGWLAALGVLFTFLLAVVAARVSGETAITPVGAMGKVTQLLFGVLAPGQAAPNLMAANVTGGAASQCGDLLHDMKAGHLLGAVPRLQATAQVFGAMAGALAGSAAYLVLIPDPANQLLTPEWPAPAAAAWAAVAEIFMRGLEAMPAGAVPAMAWAGGVGIVLAVLEKKAPARWRVWVPSPASIGLAFVIPGYNTMSMFFGGLVAVALQRTVPGWSKKFLVVVAAGLIAGESLTGVAVALQQMLGG